MSAKRWADSELDSTKSEDETSRQHCYPLVRTVDHEQWVFDSMDLVAVRKLVARLTMTTAHQFGWRRLRSPTVENKKRFQAAVDVRE